MEDEIIEFTNELTGYTNQISERLFSFVEQLKISAADLDIVKQEFEHEKEKFEKEKEKIKEFNKAQKDIISLNVGGKTFSTTRKTLCVQPDSMLAAMFSGRHVLETGKIIIIIIIQVII